jgi:hypothetical protein
MTSANKLNASLTCSCNESQKVHWGLLVVSGENCSEGCSTFESFSEVLESETHDMILTCGLLSNVLSVWVCQVAEAGIRL